MDYDDIQNEKLLVGKWFTYHEPGKSFDMVGEVVGEKGEYVLLRVTQGGSSQKLVTLREIYENKTQWDFYDSKPE